MLNERRVPLRFLLEHYVKIVWPELKVHTWGSCSILNYQDILSKHLKIRQFYKSLLRQETDPIENLK